MGVTRIVAPPIDFDRRAGNRTALSSLSPFFRPWPALRVELRPSPPWNTHVPDFPPSDAQHCHQGSTPGGVGDQPGLAGRRQGAGGKQGRERLRHRGRQACGSGHRRRHPHGLPRPRHPRRGVGARARREGQRVPVDHRSAGRHHQLHPRLPRLRGVHRARVARRRAAGGGLRPEPQRPVLRLARPRRLPQRPPPARVQAPAPGRLADRHGFPVPQGRQLQALHEDVRGDLAAVRRPAPPGRRVAGSLLRRRGLVRRLLRDRAEPVGHRRRLADHHRGRWPDRQLQRRGRLPVPA